MYRLAPDMKVSVSVKLHGTSMCLGNVKIKKPITFSKTAEMMNKIRKDNYKKLKTALKTSRSYTARRKMEGKLVEAKEKIKPGYTVGFGTIYSSRTVIKNQYINKKVTGGFYGTDVWADYYDLLKGKIPEGYEIFGEIVGYVSGSQTYIQKNYDYGCDSGKNKLMIYRVTYRDQEGKLHEMDVPEVLEFSKGLVKKYPELSDKIHHIDLLYNGTLAELYPEITVDESWGDNILAALKSDKEHFGMEQKEPLCHNKVPREGVVFRVDGDPGFGALKLKCSSFLLQESKLVDAGEVDIEMTQGYGEGN